MFITSPKVHIIAGSQRHSLWDWILDSGLTEIAQKRDTPLGRLALSNSPASIVEFAGRHCYRSWSAGRLIAEYIENIVEEQHTSVLEHVTLTFAIQGVSRSFTLEHNRHRVGIALSQESQRYVNASEVNFVIPPLYLLPQPAGFLDRWKQSCEVSLLNYQLAVKESELGSDAAMKKRRLEAARSVLPNAAETRLVWTANIQALRHYFIKRGSPAADLEIRRFACLLFKTVTAHRDLGLFFYDLHIEDGDFGVPTIVKD